VFERIPITSLLIDAPTMVNVSRNSVHTFNFIIDEGTLGDRIIWTVNNPTFATVTVEDGVATVTARNLPGMVILTATDPDSGLRHTITLRIV